MSEAGNGSSIASNCSQVKNAFCRHWPSVFFPRPASRGEGRAAPHPGHELILRAACARCKLHVSKPLICRRFVAGKPQDATIAITTHSPELIDLGSSRSIVHGHPSA